MYTTHHCEDSDQLAAVAVDVGVGTIQDRCMDGSVVEGSVRENDGTCCNLMAPYPVV